MDGGDEMTVVQMMRSYAVGVEMGLLVEWWWWVYWSGGEFVTRGDRDDGVVVMGMC